MNDVVVVSIIVETNKNKISDSVAIKLPDQKIKRKARVEASAAINF